MNTIIAEDFSYILSDANIDWERFSGKTVVISGAGGFLPFYMAGTLLFLNKTGKLEKPVKVIGLVRNIEKARKKFEDFADDENLRLIKSDLSEKIHLDETVDYIVHAASQASPKLFFSDPVGTIKANTVGTINLLDLAVEKKVESFLYFSSGEANGNIFDTLDNVSENDYGIVNPLEVRSCYAESKRMGENLCAAYAHQYGISTKIVRPSHTYGPGFALDDGRVFAAFVADVLNGRDIVLKSDGKANRCFIYLADAARGYFTVLLKGEAGNAYNVSNDYEISILNLAEIVLQASCKTNLQIRFDIDSKSCPSAKNQHALMNNGKLKALGWKPAIKEAEGLKRVINSFIGEDK